MKFGPVVFQIETLIGYNVPVFMDPSLNPFPLLSIIGNVFFPPRKKVQFGSKANYKRPSTHSLLHEAFICNSTRHLIFYIFFFTNNDDC